MMEKYRIIINFTPGGEWAYVKITDNDASRNTRFRVSMPLAKVPEFIKKASNISNNTKDIDSLVSRFGFETFSRG